MSKELTPLETLKKIGKYRITIEEFGEEVIFEETDFYNIIETELKNSQNTIDKLSNEIKHLKATDRRNKKKLKALEVIKEKGCIALDVDYENYDEWKKHHIAFMDVDTGEFPLTKEEFDLLKEVLK